MIKLIQEGKPIPGIRQIPNTIERDPVSLSNTRPYLAPDIYIYAHAEPFRLLNPLDLGQCLENLGKKRLLQPLKRVPKVS